MMVTTGGRDSRASGASTLSARAVSTSPSATRLGRWPISVTTSSAVSGSIAWLMVAITPMRISVLTTSALRELLDRDDLGDRDLAIDLLLRHVVGVLATALALQAAALLRHRPAAEVVLTFDRTADVDLVRPALGRLATRARGRGQPLVDGGPHRRPAHG